MSRQTMGSGCALSIVIPTYNERENVAELIKLLEKSLPDLLEIVIVDDSSPDGTADLCRLLNHNKKYRNIRVFVRKKKSGVGSAYFFGYKKSRGEIIIGMDADLSHNPEQIPLLLRKLDEGYDLVIGSRHIKGSFYERQKPETYMKYLASKYGNVLTSLVLGIPLHDFTNGFRAFRRKVLNGVRIENKGNSMLMEFIAKVYWRGFRVAEVPTAFVDRKRGASKLKLFGESKKFFMDALRLRLQRAKISA